MLFKRLVLATGNVGKYKEFIELLSDTITDELVFAPDLAPLQVKETGSTYAMNAFLKATAWAAASGTPSLADDSGLEVEALGWGPGVHSARITAGSDNDRNQWLLDSLRGESDRRACFVAALALAVPNEWTMICEGVCWGHIADGPSGAHGFGYDPLFIPDGYDVSFGELPQAEKNRISHRALAVKELVRLLSEQPGDVPAK